jgi:hypothetical protein
MIPLAFYKFDDLRVGPRLSALGNVAHDLRIRGDRLEGEPIPGVPGKSTTRLVSSRWADTSDLFRTYQEEPAQGIRDRERFPPIPRGNLRNFLDVPSPYPEDDL